MWQLLWKAIKTRGGSRATAASKVKGHSTLDDISDGGCTSQQCEGNNMSDICANKGMCEAAKGCTTRAIDCIMGRRALYLDWMTKTCTFLVAMPKADKGEREHKETLRRSLMGYDDSTHANITAIMDIEDGNRDNPATKIHIPITAVKAIRHVSPTHASLATDILHFITSTSWTKAANNCETGGATWLEIFTAFDTGNYRSRASVIRKAGPIHKRALARTATARGLSAPGGRGVRNPTVEPKPSLRSELEVFKKVFTRLIKIMKPEDAEMFDTHKGQYSRRPAKMGILGHFPTTKVILNMSNEQRLTVHKAILAQRSATSAKLRKRITELIHDNITIAAEADMVTCYVTHSIAQSNAANTASNAESRLRRNEVDIANVANGRPICTQ